VKARAYYWRWLVTAFRPSWGPTETVATILGFLVPPIAKLVPEAPDILDLSWQMPLCVFGLLFVTRVILAPWLIHNEQETENNKTVAVAELERDNANRAAEAIRQECDARPTDPEDIREYLQNLGLEGRKIDQQSGDGKEWLERARRIAKESLRDRHYELFCGECSERVSDCATWLVQTVNLKTNAFNPRFKIPKSATQT
jgi:hypothetical protein